MARSLRTPSLIIALLALFLAPSTQAGPDVVVLGLFKGKAVLEINGTRRVLSEGQASPEGLRLISADSEGAVLEINGQRSRHALGSHIGSRFTQASRKEVRIWPDSSGMYLVSGVINSYSVDFLVDTGATFISMNSTQARRLEIDYLLDGKPTMLETASGREMAYRVTLDSVVVGGIQVRNVTAVILEGNLPTHMLLGMSFLQRLDMQRDGQALVLRTQWD